MTLTYDSLEWKTIVWAKMINEKRYEIKKGSHSSNIQAYRFLFFSSFLSSLYFFQSVPFRDF
jgi:hypothetical protein